MKHPKAYESTPETRKRMSKVKLKGGKAETILAKALWKKGYRYRKNDKRLSGSPDIAILKHRVAVLWTVSFGMEKTGKYARNVLFVIASIGSKRLKKIWRVICVMINCCFKKGGYRFTSGKKM